MDICTFNLNCDFTLIRGTGIHLQMSTTLRRHLETLPPYKPDNDDIEVPMMSWRRIQDEEKLG